MNQVDLFPSLDGHRDGATYSPEQDFVRLNKQQRAVFDAMSDNRWHSLQWLARQTGHPETSVSARLRDLRKPRFGGFQVDRKRDGGTFLYRLTDGEQTQAG